MLISHTCEPMVDMRSWHHLATGWGNPEIDKKAVNSLSPRQNGRYNADDIFKCIFLNENVWFPTKISLKFVPKGPINNIQALVQIMAWRRPGDKPLSEPMMVRLPTHICVTQPQWVNSFALGRCSSNSLSMIFKCIIHNCRALHCSVWNCFQVNATKTD